MDAIIQLLNNYTLEGVLIVIVLLISGGLGIERLVKNYRQQKQAFLEADRSKQQHERKIEQQLSKQDELINKLLQSQTDISNSLSSFHSDVDNKFSDLTDDIKILMGSDMADIKQDITDAYYKYSQLGGIYNFMLQSLEKRFEYYVQQGGNSYVESMMNKIRALPIISSTNKE